MAVMILNILIISAQPSLFAQRHIGFSCYEAGDYDGEKSWKVVRSQFAIAVELGAFRTLVWQRFPDRSFA
jgi:hypothetical protein